MYKAGTKIPPYAKSHATDGDQDMWIQEIDFVIENGDEWPRVIDHSGCIEVRAEEEDLLNRRVDEIIDALNSNLKVFD